MGEGLDKVARSLLDLEPSAILDLFILYPDPVNKPESYVAVHNGGVFKKGVVWQGLTYNPIGMQIDGFEVSADGRMNRPKIQISNKDYFITAMLKKHNDFKNARVSRKRTLVKFLDDENFDGGNPYGADSTAELSSQEYIVSQKSQENKVFVEFELTSPLDLENFEVNNRRIVGKYCYWKYRGQGCQYDGGPIQKDDGQPFKDIYEKQIPITGLSSNHREYSDDVNYTTGDVVFVRNNRVRVSDPNGLGEARPLLNYFVAKTDSRGLEPSEHPDFWDKDGCNKKLSSCKLRFTSNQTVTRFVGAEEVEKIIASVDSYDNGSLADIDFTPTKQLPFLQTLSGTGGWTMIYNFSQNPRLYSKGQSLLLHTNTNVHQGLEITHYERNDYNYIYYRDLNGTNRYFSQYPKDEPSVDGLKGNKIVARVTPNNTELSTYDPRTKEKKVGVNGFSKTQTYDFFKVLAVNTNSNWNTSYTRSARLLADVEGICFWDRTLTDEEVDALYIKLDNGALVMKSYDEISNSEKPIEKELVNGLLGWWDKPFAVEGKTGFEDRSINKSDLIYNGGDNNGINFKKLYKYTYSVNENVSSQERLSFLPFGGFPGTDGFGFQR